MKDHERLPLIPIRSGSGVWLEDFDGKRYLDAVSSWWVNVFGHRNPRINARIRERLRAAGLGFRSDIFGGIGGRQVLLDDPSGNPVELFEPKG